MQRNRGSGQEAKAITWSRNPVPRRTVGLIVMRRGFTCVLPAKRRLRQPVTCRKADAPHVNIGDTVLRHSSLSAWTLHWGLAAQNDRASFLLFLASRLEFGCHERMWAPVRLPPKSPESARVRPHRLPSVPSNGPHFTRHCCPGGLQSWPQAVADRPAVRLVPIRCALAARRGHGCVGADFRQHWSLLQNCWAPRVGDIG